MRDKGQWGRLAGRLCQMKTAKVKKDSYEMLSFNYLSSTFKMWKTFLKQIEFNIAVT